MTRVPIEISDVNSTFLLTVLIPDIISMFFEPIKFQGKYRTTSCRLPYHDYGSNGSYFVTICTKNKEPWFGYIKNSVVCLSDIGGIVANEWLKTLHMRKYVSCTYWVVMPDHFHAIVNIDKPKSTPLHQGDVETLRATSLHDPRNETDSKFYSNISPKKQSLPSVIRSFKSAASCAIHLTEPSFQWQSRFYEHIIHNEPDYNRIAAYIQNNPKH